MITASELGPRVEKAFGEVVQWAAASEKRLYVNVETERLHEVFDWLRAEVPGLRYGTATVMDLRDGVGVYHHVNVNGAPLVITLKVSADKPDPRVPSMAAKVSAARWIEREMSELVGVTFVGHPDARRLLKAEANQDVYPLRRDFDVDAFKEGRGELPDF